MDTILLTADGSASARAAYRGLKALGCRVIGCDIYPKEWNVNSCDMDGFFQVPLAVNGEAYIAALMEGAMRFGCTAILPLTDVEVDALAPCRERFTQAGIALYCLDETAASRCRDKLGMARFLRDHGLCDTIDTYPASAVPEDAMIFPMMLKPQRGRSSSGQVIVRSREEFASAVKTRDDFIAQPFLSGNIFTVDVARDVFGSVAALPREEMLRTGNGLGTTVRIAPSHPLRAVAEGIASAAGLVGVVNMEFIAHEDRYYFLEINPRYSGGVGFSCLAGYDFIEATLRCYTARALAPMGEMGEQILAQRYEQYVMKT